MPVDFSEDEIFGAIAGLNAPEYQVDNRLSTPSIGEPVPFSDELPAPRPSGNKRNIPKLDDEPLDSVDNQPPPAYKRDAAYAPFDIIEKTLNSEVGQNALHAEIEKLGHSAAGVEACFKNVARGFEKTLEFTTTDQQISDMKKFQQTWDVHHKTYVKLVWHSRRVAGQARTVATDFAGDFLDVIADQKYSVAEKKREIANYRKELERDRENSEKLSQGFSNLQSAVAEFQVDVRDYSSTSKAQKLRDGIERITKEVEAIKVQLSKLTKQTLLLAVCTIGLGAASAGTLAVGVLCPPLWIATACAAYQTVKRGKETWAKNQERRATCNQLEEQKKILLDYQRSLEGLEKISVILCTLGSDMDFIQEKLGVFAKIWIFVHADLVEIEKQLDRASETEMQDYFARKIKAVSTIYKSLARALYWYETNVHVRELNSLSNF